MANSDSCAALHDIVHQMRDIEEGPDALDARYGFCGDLFRSGLYSAHHADGGAMRKCNSNQICLKRDCR
jgi:hypothetical protein